MAHQVTPREAGTRAITSGGHAKRLAARIGTRTDYRPLFWTVFRALASRKRGKHRSFESKKGASPRARRTLEE